MTELTARPRTLEVTRRCPISVTASDRPRRLRLSTLVTAGLSLALHGAALAALLGWSGAQMSTVGYPSSIEVLLIAGEVGSAAAESGSALPSGPESEEGQAAESLSMRPGSPDEAGVPTPAVMKREPESKSKSELGPRQPIEPWAVESDFLPETLAARETRESPSQASPPPAVLPPIKPLRNNRISAKASQPQQASLPEAEPAAAGSSGEDSRNRDPQAGAAGPSGGKSPGGKSPGIDSAGGGGARSASPAAGNRPPAYPMIARRRGQEGLVVLQVTVGPRGRVAAVQVAASSGYPVLDRAAADAVESWLFEPAREGGQSVAARVEVPVRFRLTE